MARTKSPASAQSSATICFEAKLWLAADKLRNNMDAAEYKHVILGLMPVAINQGFIALKCNDRASNFFMLNWCQTNMAEIESRATGTTFAEISKQNFCPLRVVLPPKELMAAFTAKVAPLYAQITANLRQPPPTSANPAPSPPCATRCCQSC